MSAFDAFLLPRDQDMLEITDGRGAQSFYMSYVTGINVLPHYFSFFFLLLCDLILSFFALVYFLVFAM